jgi:hypothetical protein
VLAEVEAAAAQNAHAGIMQALLVVKLSASNNELSGPRGREVGFCVSDTWHTVRH